MKKYAVLVALLTLSGCLAVGPAGAYKNGQVVDLSITQFDPGNTVWLSECAPAQVPTAATGCRPTLAGQPSVRLDSHGSGSAHFRVASSVAGINCAGYCTIAATNGKRLQSKPISFVATGRVDVFAGFGSPLISIYINGKFFYANQNGRGMPAFVTRPGVYHFAFFEGTVTAASKPVASAVVGVRAGQATSLIVDSPTGSGYRALQTVEPPPAPPGQLRLRFVNTAPFVVTPTLDNVAQPPMAPGEIKTILWTPPANVANLKDSVTFTYAPQPPATTPCSAPFATGFWNRGHGYVATILYVTQAQTTCHYLVGTVSEGGEY